MIIIFGKENDKATKIEKKILGTLGREFIFYDIDSKQGKKELRKRGLVYNEVKNYIPWVINEVPKNEQ